MLIGRRKDSVKMLCLLGLFWDALIGNSFPVSRLAGASNRTILYNCPRIIGTHKLHRALSSNYTLFSLLSLLRALPLAIDNYPSKL